MNGGFKVHAKRSSKELLDNRDNRGFFVLDTRIYECFTAIKCKLPTNGLYSQQGNLLESHYKISLAERVFTVCRATLRR